jgi:charged multivesicular body protein 7
MEKSDQEAKEEREAEGTRQRLAELDSIKQASDEATRRAQKTKDVDSELAESIGRLSNMSVEDSPLPAK